MTPRARQDFRFNANAFDSTVAEPTSKLLLESMSRMKAGPAASVAGPLGHLFPAPADDHSGQFRLVCEIASGGMATVHLGINRGPAGFEKFAAVKRIHPHLARDKEFYEMFIDEARIAAQVNHPFVCSVFDFGLADQSYYIAMEFLNGEPLSKVLACAGTRGLSEARFPKLVARIVANLAEGLHAAHSLCDAEGNSLDIIHRDVTPQNLFVLYDGTVRVTDFGIARARHRLHHTHGQRLKGTLGYMSPEQLQRSELDQGVDIWALGVVMWEMLTARGLFQSASEGELVMEILSRTIAPPSAYNPRVSPALDKIVMRALERKRSNRYASAREFSRALEQYLTSTGASVHATDVAEWLGKLFPTGKQRGRELLDSARASVQRQPRSERSEELPPSTRREPLAGRARPPSEPARDKLGSLPALAIALDDAARVSLPEPTQVSAGATRSRRMAEHAIGIALLGTLALIGLGGPESLLRRAPAAAAQPAPRVVTLSALMPSSVAQTEAKSAPQQWSAPAQIEANRAPRPEPRATRPSAPKQAFARVERAPSAPDLPASLPTLPDFLPARDFAPRTQLGAVYVSTPGTQASIFEAGRLLGPTTEQLDLVAGRHTLSIKSGAESRTLVVDVVPGVVSLANVSLPAIEDQSKLP